MTKIVNLETYRQQLADLDEYASILAAQAEEIYHEPSENEPKKDTSLAENTSRIFRPLVVV